MITIILRYGGGEPVWSMGAGTRPTCANGCLMTAKLDWSKCSIDRVIIKRPTGRTDGPNGSMDYLIEWKLKLKLRTWHEQGHADRKLVFRPHSWRVMATSPLEAACTLITHYHHHHNNNSSSSNNNHNNHNAIKLDTNTATAQPPNSWNSNLVFVICVCLAIVMLLSCLSCVVGMVCGLSCVHQLNKNIKTTTVLMMIPSGN